MLLYMLYTRRQYNVILVETALEYNHRVGSYSTPALFIIIIIVFLYARYRVKVLGKQRLRHPSVYRLKATTPRPHPRPEVARIHYRVTINQLLKRNIRACIGYR